MGSSTRPLVSVGIPTYNRVEGLRSAVESVLAQGYPQIEVVISDNASEDGTRAYCEALAAGDSRVLYVRQERNQGLVANFLAVRDNASGPYFCWLADDDRLGTGSLPACVDFLEANPDYGVAVGRILTQNSDGEEMEERLEDLPQGDPAARTKAYYGQIGCNAYIYGVARLDLLRQCPFEVSLGNDWNLVGSLAFLGRVKSLPEAALLRRPHGASKDIQHLAKVLGVPAIQYHLPLLSLACGTYRSVARSSPVYASLGILGRRALALRCAVVVFRIYVWPRFAERLVAGFRLLTRPSRLFAKLRRSRVAEEGRAL